MFRVADIKAQRQVTSPSVEAYLFTWGAGHTTIEGEHIPCDVKVRYGSTHMCDVMVHGHPQFMLFMTVSFAAWCLLL